MAKAKPGPGGGGGGTDDDESDNTGRSGGGADDPTGIAGPGDTPGDGGGSSGGSGGGGSSGGGGGGGTGGGNSSGAGAGSGTGTATPDPSKNLREKQSAPTSGGGSQGGDSGASSGATNQRGTGNDISISANFFEAAVNKRREERGLDPVDTDRDMDVATFKGNPFEAREREAQAIDNFAEAVMATPETDQPISGGRQSAEAVRSDPGRGQIDPNEEADRFESVLRNTAAVTRRQERAGDDFADMRADIPGTNRTFEGAARDAVQGFDDSVAEPLGGLAGEGVSTATGSDTAGQVADTATRQTANLATSPIQAGIIADEAVVEPGARIIGAATDDDPNTTAADEFDAALAAGAEQGERALAGAGLEINETRAEMLAEGDIGTVEDPALVQVREGQDARVAGTAVAGLASAGLSAGAIKAAGRVGPRTQRATTTFIQPGEEVARAGLRGAAARGRAAASASRGDGMAVPSSDRGQLDLSGRSGRETGETITGEDIAGPSKGREQANVGLGRPTRDPGDIRAEQQVGTGPDAGGGEATGLGFRSAETEQTTGDLPAPERAPDPLDRSPIAPGRVERAAVADADALGAELDQAAAEQSELDQQTRTETAAGLDEDLRVDELSRLNARTRLETDQRAETGGRTETRTETDTRLETGTRLESGTRLETGTRVEQDRRLEQAGRVETDTRRELDDLDLLRDSTEKDMDRTAAAIPQSLFESPVRTPGEQFLRLFGMGDGGGRK